MKTQTLEAITAAVAMLTLVVALGYAMAETIERSEPSGVVVPPPPASPPVDPAAQRLIDELHKRLQAPVLSRVPFVADTQSAKVWM